MQDLTFNQQQQLQQQQHQNQMQLAGFQNFNLRHYWHLVL